MFAMHDLSLHGWPTAPGQSVRIAVKGYEPVGSHTARRNRMTGAPYCELGLESEARPVRGTSPGGPPVGSSSAYTAPASAGASALSTTRPSKR